MGGGNRPGVKQKRAGLLQKRMYEASCRYRFYPTSAQRASLAQTFGCVRVVYNKALEERERTYAETGKDLSYSTTRALLTQWKRQPEYSWLRDVSCVPLQQTLRHLNTAYQRFFKGQAKHPRFKSKNRKQSAEFTKSGFRPVAGSVVGKPHIYLPKQTEPLRIRWSRPLPSNPTPITISKDQAGCSMFSPQSLISGTQPTTAGGPAKSLPTDSTMTSGFLATHLNQRFGCEG